jgi:CelD/BcsL family acetyltransferase involved in cellulose biosynthesis
MLTLAGVGAYRANNVVDPYGKLTGAGAGVRSVSESYAMCIDGRSTSDRMEALRAEHAKRFKNFRRLGRKIETDHGELKLGWGSPDPDELGQLLAWKSDQFRREKLVDLTTATYSSHILQETGQATGDNLAGFMVKLTLNGKLLVGHFGVRAGDVFHPWISAYDRAYSAYTPGMILLLRAAPAMADMGLSTYDLAAGHRHYKKYFVNRTRRVLDLFAVSDSAAGKARQAAAGLWALAGGARPTSLVARIGRHVDHVAVSEARLGSRLARIAAASLRNAAGETAEV